MATKVILPKLGQTMEEGTIVEWYKEEGDEVGRGDVLFEIESDKAVLEVEAKTRGVLRKILLEKGIKVPVMTPVAIIAKEDEDISDLLDEAQAQKEAALGGEGAAPEEAAAERPVTPAKTEEEQPPPEAEAPEPEAPPKEEERELPPERRGRIFASPRARKTAREKEVELEQVTGTGPNGRIVEQDVLDYLERQPAATPLARRMAQEKEVALEELAPEAGRVRAAQVREAEARPRPSERPAARPAPAAGETVPMSGVRAIIAERMATSAHTTAAVTLTTVVDATEFVAARTKLKEAFAEELGFNIGYNDLLAMIVTRCLQEFPYMNARLEEEGIRQVEGVNMGMAVDSERGLLVPVIHGADEMGLKEFAQTFRELVDRARAGKAMPDDLSGGTFTITNLGMYGVDMFTPIINLPETAILGVGRIRSEPTVVDGDVAVRQRMWLSLTFDHRLVDGAPAARFLQRIGQYIEQPYLLLA
jgi:pyruvate dehydrogenase E2 component (dihydrolipoamide acetyltransferase)